MACKDDLDKFRAEWRDEVVKKGNPPTNDNKVTEGSTSAASRMAIPQQSTAKSTNSPGQTVLPEPTKSPKKHKTFQPFLIADKLLEGQTVKDSLDPTAESLHDPGGLIDSAEYFRQKPKKLRLESDDKEKIVESAKPKTLLDIFLTDLVLLSLYKFTFHPTY